MIVKKFNENINTDEPENGDYILCEINLKTKLYDFINNNISKLSYSYIWNNMQRFYVIQYENIPTELRNQFSAMKENGKMVYECEIARNGIKYFGKDKEELEIMLKTNKFNI